MTNETNERSGREDAPQHLRQAERSRSGWEPQWAADPVRAEGQRWSWARQLEQTGAEGLARSEGILAVWAVVGVLRYHDLAGRPGPTFINVLEEAFYQPGPERPPTQEMLGHIEAGRWHALRRRCR
jgi:hypothetical protein